MIIDCARCEVRGHSCGECVIGVLLGAPPQSKAVPAGAEVPSGASIVQLDAPERRALEVLAAQGLVPRLRLVAAHPRRTSSVADESGEARHAG